MPYPRGGPCDVTRLSRSSSTRLGVSMPHPRGGPCDTRQWPGSLGGLRTSFYAASSRRSLRHHLETILRFPASRVSMPHPRGGPCDKEDRNLGSVKLERFYAASSRRSLRPRYPRPGWSWRRFLCRILAAVPATYLLTLSGMCGATCFYAASSRRSLRRCSSDDGGSFTRRFLCRILAAVPATC